MVDVFKALSDPTRRAVLDELAAYDSQTSFELCHRLLVNSGVTSSRQAISQHLAVLQEVGLSLVRREGRYRFHHLDTGPLQSLLARWTSTPDGSR